MMINNQWEKTRSDELMKYFMKFICSISFLIMVFLANAVNVLSTNLYAAGLDSLKQMPVIEQRLFSSPQEAIKALQEATEDKNKIALSEIFGPLVNELLTGDKVQDANNAKRFAKVLNQGCILVKDGEDKITFEIGPNNWPMPIPLVRINGQWHFDTAAGKEEIISRHIGKDELHAIGVCRAYVIAQQQYARRNRGTQYAQRFRSSTGKKDGLYWPSQKNEQESPFSALVATAIDEGYVRNKDNGLHPFHGYYFRILTSQGNAALGGRMNYIIQGQLSGGFALVAYPQYWDHSGIMTFIVNQKGQVFQRNLGEKTSQIGLEMEEYNPDSQWTLVMDKGILNVATEK